MLGTILTSIGGSVGSFFGGGILSSIGRYAGNMLSGYLEKKWFGSSETHHKFTNVKDSFKIAKAEYGNSIPLIFGKMRVPGQIIWADRISEKRNTNSTSKYFKNRNLTVNKETTELSYYFTCAIALCEGEIIDITRVWLGDEVIDLSQYKFRLYNGSEEQMPDPIIMERSEEETPAYRGLAYIVFEDLPLADFNDVIPVFSFEILRRANVDEENLLEDMVKSMVMIPGSGEYVYDTKIQTKSQASMAASGDSPYVINSHNNYNIANSVHSLDQLQSICKNVEWVSPVVTWFADNLNAKNCTIKPAIEFRDQNYQYSEEWKVGKYNRNNAYEISKDYKNNPNYGGSVNDASVIRYLEELKKRNLKIMFYPMFFMDIPQKPWRGHVTCSANHVSDFFNKENGYNEFILHYANLVKDHVDAFVIGSELIGITKIKDSSNNFPAIKELIKLAELVKSIVGKDVIVTYAADWSEYHHTEEGWYNLDPLWACDAIDVIGIDAYFPATRSMSSIITDEELEKGWNSGEGYDYYIDQYDEKHNLDAPYAWKNIRYWWENKHRNPDGNETLWKPKSKLIWFTEFGFPSIDKASNKPNVFYDPKCIDGGIPTYSNGRVDFAIQRKSIRAFLDYWGTQEYIGQMFLWTWDARPYPAWPHTKIWSDGDLWEKGHWVNDKFGLANLSSILLELSKRSDIDISKIDVKTVDEVIEGIIFSNQISILNAINTLRSAYFFDICSSDQDAISFKKRGAQKEILVNSKECLKLSDNSFVEEVEIPKDTTLSKIDLHFINHNKEYKRQYHYINNEQNSFASNASIRLPIAMRPEKAKKIGELILKNSAVENRLIKFILPDIDLRIKPADFVAFVHHNIKYSIRIINMEFKNNSMIIVGIIDDRNLYFYSVNAKNPASATDTEDQTQQVIILDSPLKPEDSDSYLSVYFRGKKNSVLYTKFPNQIDSGWNKLTTLKNSYGIGKVISFNQPVKPDVFFIDEVSVIIVRAYKLENCKSMDWQYVLVGEELIAFKNITKLQNNEYRISSLIRGQKDTDKFMTQHKKDEDFLILNKGENILPISDKLFNKEVLFKAGDIEKSITYKKNSQTEISPYITKQEIKNNKLHLQWVTRIRNCEDWSLSEPSKKIKFDINIYSNDQTYSYKSDNNEIIIDISTLELSANYKIDIISNITTTEDSL